MEKMEKYSKWALSFLSFWKGLVIVTMVIILFVDFLLLLSTGSNPNAVDHITLDFLEFTTTPGTIDHLPKSLIWIQLLYYTLSASYSLYVISMLKKVITPMTQGLPFDRQIGPTIRRIAWLQLIANGLGAALMMVDHVMTYRYFYLSDLFLNDSIASCRLSLLNLDDLVGTGITFCVLFLLSYVFEYGQELQKLSDETL